MCFEGNSTPYLSERKQYPTTPCPAFEVADFCNCMLRNLSPHSQRSGHICKLDAAFCIIKVKEWWLNGDLFQADTSTRTCPERPRRHSLGNWSSSKVIKVEESIAGRPGPFNCSLKGHVTSTWMRFTCFRQMELRFMWWGLLIGYRHKRFNSCRSQALKFKRVAMD